MTIEARSFRFVSIDIQNIVHLKRKFIEIETL
jgi:hypothetical protein